MDSGFLHARDSAGRRFENRFLENSEPFLQRSGSQNRSERVRNAL